MVKLFGALSVVDQQKDLAYFMQHRLKTTELDGQSAIKLLTYIKNAKASRTYYGLTKQVVSNFSNGRWTSELERPQIMEMLSLLI